MTSTATQDRVTVAISIDTEEDNWGSYAEQGATTENIAHLPELQELFDRWGAHATYLVNRPPLVDRDSVEILGSLALNSGVEIGAHCHPWNTPPFGDEGASRSMMCSFSYGANRAKIREIRQRLQSELGVDPKVFRAGRWGFGPTVAGPLVDEAFEIDCSVAPFVDWSSIAGPDSSRAPHLPYRFDPGQPFRPNLEGRLLELPTTIGMLAGNHRRRAAGRLWLARSPLRHLKVVGVLDRLGVLTLRWLSPETSSGETMIRLAKACILSGQSFLQLTFHSSTLLPGATPFVKNEHDRARFLESLDQFLSYCNESGFAFRTLSESGRHLDPQND